MVLLTDVHGDVSSQQTQVLNTLEMGKDMLMLSVAEWPVSEFMHAKRVGVM